MESVKFKLFMTEYTIDFVDEALIDSNGAFYYGECNTDTNKITVSLRNPEGSPLSESEVYITVFHELVHLIFDDGQYKDESSNEPLVEWTGKCLAAINEQNVADSIKHALKSIDKKNGIKRN